ncbi:MAG: crossover junction endodeoxyribonuclease RuvC [Micrococcaceae bacterium]
MFGIDPGLTRCGLGVIEVDHLKKIKVVNYSTEGTSAKMPLEDRLFHIHKVIDQWFDKYQPDALAIERVFYNQNVSTAMATAQVVGIAMVAAKTRDIPVETYTPPEIKSSVTGYGKADKAAVTKMVMKFLKLKEKPETADAADSLAIALTHAWRRTPQSKTGTNTMTSAQKKWIAAELEVKARNK